MNTDKNSFYPIFQNYSWQATHGEIYSKTETDVLRALKAKRRTLEDFKALISPAAKPFLEFMASESMRITQQRFGNTIQMYTPCIFPMNAKIFAPIVVSASQIKSHEKH